MIWVLHSDIILGDIRSDILRDMHKKSVTYGNKEKWIWLKGDGMVTDRWLNGHWYVSAIPSTKWWLQGHWIAPLSFYGMVVFRLW